MTCKKTICHQQLELRAKNVGFWTFSHLPRLQKLQTEVGRSFYQDSSFAGKSLLFRLLLQPLSCQKKNISRNFIYNIFLLTFSLTSQGCRNFKLNLEEVSIAGGFLLEKNFPGEGCSVGFRLQFHGFLGVSPRF